MKRLLVPGLAVVVIGIGAVAAVLAADGDPAPFTGPAPLTADSPFRYPIALWDGGIEGETVVMVHVTEMGRVDSVYVLLSSGHTAFDSAALAGARQIHFSPGRRGDERVGSWARLPVRFRIPADSAEAREP